MIKLKNILKEIKVRKPITAEEIYDYWCMLRGKIHDSNNGENDFNEIGEILRKYINQFDALDDRGFQKYNTKDRIKMLTQNEHNQLYGEFLPYIRKYNVSIK